MLRATYEQTIHYLWLAPKQYVYPNKSLSVIGDLPRI
jgi:hypothetical protein